METVNRRLCEVTIISVALALQTTVLSASEKRPQKLTVTGLEFQKNIGLEVGDFPLPWNSEICVALLVGLESGDFFTGLSRTKSASGVQYRKGNVVVVTFPDTVKMLIRAKAIRCDLTPSSLGPRLDDHFMKSLRFEAASKRGLLSVPAEQITFTAYKVPFTESGPDQWAYELLIRLNQVCITDQLTLSVFYENRKLLTRITGGLDRAFNPPNNDAE